MKRILSCLFGGMQKVQVTKFALRTSSLLWVLLQTRLAQRLSSQYFAAVLTPSIHVVELVPSVFFCPQPWLLWQYEHIFPEKHPSV